MTIRHLFILIICGLLFQSCGFFFYNYRCKFDCDFSIPNQTSDTNLRYSVGQFIDKLSYRHNFYNRTCSKTYDSLYFYGPDYHKLKFKIREINQTTNIHFHYFGYNGSRRHPPNKYFIQSVTDSLKLKFGATQTINLDVSNERKKKNGT